MVEKERREVEYREIEALLKVPMINGDRVLLLLQKVWMKFGIDSSRIEINVFFDNGSTCSLILTHVAEQYGLLGQDIIVTLSTVNSSRKRHTKLYVIELVDLQGRRRIVRAIGVERISSTIPEVDLDGVKLLFSDKLRRQWEKVTARPRGEIQLLVGSEVASLHPIQEEAVDELVIAKSQFGDGWAIHGTHDKLKANQVDFDEDVEAIRAGGFRILECGKIYNEVTLSYTQDWRKNPWTKPPIEKNAKEHAVEKVSSIPKDFIKLEDLGVEPPR